jgi:thymidine phosphorylase
VSPGAGVVMHAKPGERVRAGGPILSLHADSVERFPAALEALEGAVEIVDGPHGPAPLILDRVAAA